MWRVTRSWRNYSDWLFAYIKRVGDGLSQLINVVVFLSDNPNESLSGRSYRQREILFWGVCRVSIDTLFWVLEKNHCQKSHEADKKRATIFLEQNGV